MKKILSPCNLIGSCREIPGPKYLDNSVWYAAEAAGDTLVYDISEGELAQYKYISFDLYLESLQMAKHTFRLTLKEAGGKVFWQSFALVPHMTARLRLPLSMVDQNILWMRREGGLIKPSIRGERIDINKVSKLELRLERIGAPITPIKWCQTPLVLSVEEPEMLKEPVFPDGPLVDEMGQSRIHDVKNKFHSTEELQQFLIESEQKSDEITAPDHLSEWGGWKGKQLEATGFFRTHYDGTRWWFVDPDGYLFWSSGLDCVRPGLPAPAENMEGAYSWLPERVGEFADARHVKKKGKRGDDENPGINHLRANLIRAFGKEQWHSKWKKMVSGQIKKIGFNTIANWSDCELAQEANIPYVTQLDFNFSQTPLIYKDFPDVYSPTFEEEASRMAEMLRSTVASRALIGYFLQNEAEWAFSKELPAAGMLFTSEGCCCRDRLAEWLEKKYATEENLSEEWKMSAEFSAIKSGKWKRTLTPQALADLEEFTVLMVDRLYGVVSTCCRKVDPHHLNLGTRFPGEPAPWTLEGMKHVDALSINCYKKKLPESFAVLSKKINKPIIIGEWHFGAVDAGLPGMANQMVCTQKERGDAFRIYNEWAAAQWYCIGSHYFRCYDNPTMGRGDGENYNIGFFNVCCHPYEEIVAAAQETHHVLYEVAAGKRAPFEKAVDYLGL